MPKLISRTPDVAAATDGRSDPHFDRFASRYIWPIILAYITLVPIVAIRISDSVAFGVADVLLPVSTVIALFCAIYRRFPLRFDLFALTLFLVCGLVSTTWHATFGTYSPELALYLRVVAIFIPFTLVMAIHQLTARDLGTALNVLFFSGLISLIIGIALHHMGITMRQNVQMNWYGAAGIASTARAAGLLGNSGDFGHLAAIWSVSVAALSAITRRRSIFYIVALSLGLYAVYISSSRAAMVHIVVGFSLLSPLLFRGSRLLFAAIALVITAMVASTTLPPLYDNPILYYNIRRLDIINITGDTLFYSTPRLSNWRYFLTVAADNFGLGIGYKNIFALTGRPGDNSFLTVGVELGILAGLFYLLFWMTLAFRGATISDGRMRSAACAVICSEIAHMLTVDTHSMWATTPVSIILIAVILKFSETNDQRSNPRTPHGPTISGNNRGM